MERSQPHVVVIGGGFAGLWCTRALASAPLQITLVDRANHHLFQPLLYQVATSQLASTDIAFSLRKLFRASADALLANRPLREIATPESASVRGLSEGEFAALRKVGLATTA